MTLIINGIDVSDDLVVDTLKIQNRCDIAFAQGQCQLYTDQISKNIPPYTLCTIDGVKYFISSSATQDMQNTAFYTHNCQILELTSILQCYILGTKRFSAVSQHNDKKKIQIIGELIENKYGCTFTYSFSLRNLNHEFSFGAGTTMYQAVTEILTWYNARPKVTDITLDLTGNIANITLEVFSLDDDGVFVLSTNRIISKEYTQNSDDYGAILESEMQNVVDRNEPITFSNLTCRSDDVLFNADSAVIMLPTKVEQITKVTCYNSQEIKHEISIVFSSNFYDSLGASRQAQLGLSSDSDRMSSSAKTWEQWRSILICTNASEVEVNVCDEIYNQFFKDYGFDYDEFKTYTWYIWNRPNASNNDYRFRFTPVPTAWASDTGSILSSTYHQNITGTLEVNVVEKTKWDTLDAYSKAENAYYETGGNRIENLCKLYNDGVIQNTFGLTSDSPITKPKHYNTELKLLNYVSGSYLKATIDYTASTTTTNPLAFVYNVTCVPIANPVLISKNTSATPNENATRLLAKSYEKSSSIISFDNVMKSMKDVNKMLGQPELSIEYDITGLDSTPDLAFSTVVDGSTYYLMSYMDIYHRNRTSRFLNLCSSYSKIADAIGIETQFTATRLPIDEIVERPIYMKEVSVNSNNIDVTNGLLGFKFYNEDSQLITTLFKKPIKLDDNNGTFIIYAECIDNYAFDTKIVNGDGTDISSAPTSGNFQCKSIPYGDNYNEIYWVQILYYSNIKLTALQSYNLPYFDTNLLPQPEWSKKRVLYKDSREKLTFTIICNYTESE